METEDDHQLDDPSGPIVGIEVGQAPPTLLPETMVFLEIIRGLSELIQTLESGEDIAQPDSELIQQPNSQAASDRQDADGY